MLNVLQNVLQLEKEPPHGLIIDKIDRLIIKSMIDKWQGVLHVQDQGQDQGQGQGQGQEAVRNDQEENHSKVSKYKN